MSSPALRAVLAIAVAAFGGVLAFVVTVNRTQVAGDAPRVAPPVVAPVVAPSPTRSLDDLARAQLGSTVTIETLATSQQGLGTGWLLDGRGDFVTNAHVIQGQLAVRIRGRDGSSHVGDVVGVDRVLDVAVVRSRGGFRGTPLTTFAGVVGQFPEPVVAVASSHATGHGDLTDESLTRVAGDVPLTRDTGGPLPTNLVYHDMLVLDGQTIYPGNSGGPVLDRDGRVVGIVTLASRSAAEAYAIQLNRVLGELLAFAAR